jgi:uncharacterized membrane protein
MFNRESDVRGFSQHDPEDDPRATIFTNMRRSFLRGLAIIIPIAITVWVLWFIFQFIDGIASPFYRQIGLNIPGLGFITAVVLILFLGIFSRYLAGKVFFRILERVFLTVPWPVRYTAVRASLSMRSRSDRRGKRSVKSVWSNTRERGSMRSVLKRTR